MLETLPSETALYMRWRFVQQILKCQTLKTSDTSTMLNLLIKLIGIRRFYAESAKISQDILSTRISRTIYIKLGHFFYVCNYFRCLTIQYWLPCQPYNVYYATFVYVVGWYLGD